MRFVPVRILLDALAAIGLLEKQDERYSLPPPLVPLLQDASPQSVIAMLRHQANCMRRWSRLPWTVQTGVPQDPGPSTRGIKGDQASFIAAMHEISRDICTELIRQVNPGGVRCVLDVGGAAGSWTCAWLEAEPAACAVLFDLPHVIAMARSRLAQHSAASRMTFVSGDFDIDPLPRGADLAWVSAIVHQNSPEQNRSLYRRIAAALEPGGWILIRDIVMDSERTRPLAGALFAVNMLAATPGGNTYTLAEITDDLSAAGFSDVQLVRKDEGMHSVVRARLGSSA